MRFARRDIIYVSISGFGENGPYSKQRAYDPVIPALSGLAEIQRDRDTGRPRMVRTIIADYTTDLTAAQAISAALFARQRSGNGQHVRLAMLDAMIPISGPQPPNRRPRPKNLNKSLVFLASTRPNTTRPCALNRRRIDAGAVFTPTCGSSGGSSRVSQLHGRGASTDRLALQSIQSICINVTAPSLLDDRLPPLRDELGQN